MDIYVVLDDARLVGASAKLQGAEIIRVEEAERLAKRCNPGVDTLQQRIKFFYDSMTVVNTDLRDMDD